MNLLSCLSWEVEKELELHPCPQLQSCGCCSQGREQGGLDWFSLKQGIAVARCSLKADL